MVFKKTIFIYVAGLEWYMYQPFLQVCIFYRNDIDLMKWNTPPWEDLDRILTTAYNSIQSYSYRNMRKFFDDLIINLKRYVTPINPFNRQANLPRSARDTYKRYRTDQESVDINDLQLSKAPRSRVINDNIESNLTTKHE